jgi:protoporphyrinogen oxidase
LMKGELLVRPRKSVIRLQHKFFSYPIQIFDVLANMNPYISLKCAMEFMFTKFGRYSSLADDSFQNWVIKRFGRTLYDIYFGCYSHKLWGISPAQISSDWAAQRISLINISDVIMRALGKKKDVPKTYALNFLYPRQGIGQIAESMVEEIVKNKGRVSLDSKVERIIIDGPKIKEVIYVKDGRQMSISADFIISTIPLPEFVMAIEPRVEEEYLAIAKAMSFRSIKLLHLLLNIEYVSDNTWIYLPEEEYLAFRIQDRRNWSPTCVPQGKNALTLEIACNKGDDIWNASDNQIYARCIRDLEELKLIKSGAVEGYFTQTAEHAYPLYSLDYKQKIRIMFNLLNSIENFLAIGRQGLFRYNNMDHSFKMGFLAAKHILEGHPREKILPVATENSIFDWQDPGYHNGTVIERNE